MNNFFGLFADENENEKAQNNHENEKLRLHKEELDITKRRGNLAKRSYRRATNG
ncbi:hypothetical protein [Priestia megaterium]|uniref:hypothetical protein n=1 Tax=Priestia megaterium TaxID=1404 RepID=UPI0020D219D2|nr:hypothetical protein [Priestia megaterium]